MTIAWVEVLVEKLSISCCFFFLVYMIRSPPHYTRLMIQCPFRLSVCFICTLTTGVFSDTYSVTLVEKSRGRHGMGNGRPSGGGAEAPPVLGTNSGCVHNSGRVRRRRLRTTKDDVQRPNTLSSANENIADRYRMAQEIWQFPRNPPNPASTWKSRDNLTPVGDELWALMVHCTELAGEYSFLSSDYYVFFFGTCVFLWAGGCVDFFFPHSKAV